MNYSVDIPTIDITPLAGQDNDAKALVVRKIHYACRSTGFFYASNHGIDVVKFHSIVNEFHRTMTDEEKWDLAINAYNKNNNQTRSGYYMAIPGKKAVESFSFINPAFNEMHPKVKARIPLYEINVWPELSKYPEFRPFMECYFNDMFDLSALILRGMALALGQNERFFDSYYRKEDTLSSVRLIRYPCLKDYPTVKTASDGTKLGFGDHLDVSLITLLFQTPVPNLQVEIGDNMWYDVPVSDSDFLVNCGTYMAHITNNYFHAPNHRVKHINAERFSLPFFVNLDYESIINPFSPHSSSETVPHGKFLIDGFNSLVVKNGQT